MFRKNTLLLSLIVCLHILSLVMVSVAEAASYETESMQVLYDLQKGHYDKVESFFQKAHADKRLYEHGREVMGSTFSCWYLNDYYLKPGLLEHINAWIIKYPNSVFPYVARAEFYYKDGWRQRGGYWAQLTADDQVKAFHNALEKASTDLEKVLAQDPTIPFVYERLIAIAGQMGKFARVQPLQLIEDAKKNQVYDMYGLHSAYMRFSLVPKWGGSAEQLLAYARDASKDVPADSTFPMLLFSAHVELTHRQSHAEKKAYYASAGIWDEIEWAFKRVHAAYPKGVAWMVRYADVAYDAGKYDLAGEYLNRAYTIDPGYSDTYLKIGSMYMQNSSQYALAEQAYQDYLKLRVAAFASAQNCAGARYSSMISGDPSR